MEALKLTRKDYEDGVLAAGNATVGGKPYMELFSVEFPDGINTGDVMEICRAIQDPSFEGRVRIAKLCIAGRKTRITCPNGQVYEFITAGKDDNLSALRCFKEEPMALIALADSVYGYILKKYIRLPEKKGRTGEPEETRKPE